MNIIPQNYVNNNQHNPFKNNSNPSFGAVHFSEAAQKKITQVLENTDTFTRSIIISNIQKIVKDGKNTKDILVDAPEFTTGLTATVRAKNAGEHKYALKTFIQSPGFSLNLKFLKDALTESRK